MILAEGILWIFLHRADEKVVSVNPAFVESVQPVIPGTCDAPAQTRIHFVSGLDLCVIENAKEVERALKP